MDNTRMLKIEPEFQNLIPPLSPDEYAILEADIIKRGCKHPIELWGNVIIDGHNRYAICKSHGIDYRTEEVLGLATRDDVIVWMTRNQLGRRNINDFVRGELVLKMKPALAAKAKEQQGNHNISATLPKSDTRKTLANEAGISERNLSKIETVLTTGIPELVEKTRAGNVSINLAEKIAKQSHSSQASALDKPPRKSAKESKHISPPLKKAKVKVTQKSIANDFANYVEALSKLNGKTTPPLILENLSEKKRALMSENLKSALVLLTETNKHS